MSSKSTRSMNIWALMAVKICHLLWNQHSNIPRAIMTDHPWNSSKKPRGSPTCLLSRRKPEQASESRSQSANPATAHTMVIRYQLAVRQWQTSSIIRAPCRASQAALFLCAGLLICLVKAEVREAMKRIMPAKMAECKVKLLSLQWRTEKPITATINPAVVVVLCFKLCLKMSRRCITKAVAKIMERLSAVRTNIAVSPKKFNMFRIYLTNTACKDDKTGNISLTYLRPFSQRRMEDPRAEAHSEKPKVWQWPFPIAPCAMEAVKCKDHWKLIINQSILKWWLRDLMKLAIENVGERIDELGDVWWDDVILFAPALHRIVSHVLESGDRETRSRGL